MLGFIATILKMLVGWFDKRKDLKISQQQNTIDKLEASEAAHELENQIRNDADKRDDVLDRLRKHGF